MRNPTYWRTAGDQIKESEGLSTRDDIVIQLDVGMVVVTDQAALGLQ